MTKTNSNANEIKCPHCGVAFTVDEANFAGILKQVRDREFEAELHTRLAEAEKTKAAEIKAAEAELTAKLAADKANLAQQIENLKNELKNAGTQKDLEVAQAIADIKQKADKLEATLKVKEAEQKTAEANLKQLHQVEIAAKEKEVELYRDMKARQSTKMVGESLEKHCEHEFNSIRAAAYPNAYFEKDTDAKTGSQGDYIFRDYVEDLEIVSIMFDMKNESDTTATKKKNEDFFKELDKDRNEKGCEYAILVSLLEIDNEYYNNGIVDVSHKYPKMFVVRPQFFLAIIALLRNNALNTVADKRELERIKQMNVDVTMFEANLNKFKKDISKSAKWANDRYNDSVADLDKAIAYLQGIKESLRLWVTHADTTDKKADELTIQALTKGNATMAAKFKELGE